ncbi:hypothetical protein [Phyllobacterium leguminum]|uniref:Uncharacterized protein n=1 Tax=Phyllobacterium leguminum TaxID=314237 RepID=A0A318TG71_9HYPH|nr:hypothetical protein [Phyllobacterium leguminum]PYE87593.1 hypothetical protein C7477_11295 [Phyllobacterium leguminum]
MSEYQYYEFQAIDQPLDRAAQEELRSFSSRARITATSFTNHYNWGDFDGDPRAFMEQWFDLHLYVANWGARRLMMRVPKRFLDPAALDLFLREIDWVDASISGDDVIIDISWDEDEPPEEWDDGTGWLAMLAPLRADVLASDLRLFYLLWLQAVQCELVSDDELEPLPGIGPLTGALEAFAEFCGIDRNLVEAAAESGVSNLPSKDMLREAVAAISEDEKTELLLRLVEGDSHVAAELKGRIRADYQASSVPLRTVSALRKRAREIADERERAEAKRREAERRIQAEQAEKARQVRLKSLRQRGAKVWSEVEEEIERRNASGYDKAASLISDLQALAAEDANQSEFARRLSAIRARHETKRKFIERLNKLV